MKKNKIAIPRFVNSIGVVTSATGAVLQDIRNVTSRRNPNLDIYVYDAQVQGKFAVNDVIQGITYFDNMTDVDVIIVARGGGSMEDLMPFNDEELARVAFICNKPLISAVGHETDFSILDFVADLRAPTPSAAAELVTFDQKEVIRYIKDLFYGLHSNILNIHSNLQFQINANIAEIDRNISSLVNENIINIIDNVNKISNLVENQINSTTYRVELGLNTLDKLNPAKLIKSGYSIVTNKNKAITYENTNIYDDVDIRISNAKFKAKITNKEEL